MNIRSIQVISRTITHIHPSGGADHQHIVRYKWVDASGGVGDDDKPTMVGWIDNKKGLAYVGAGSNRVPVASCTLCQVSPSCARVRTGTGQTTF